MNYKKIQDFINRINKITKNYEKEISTLSWKKLHKLLNWIIYYDDYCNTYLTGKKEND